MLPFRRFNCLDSFFYITITDDFNYIITMLMLYCKQYLYNFKITLPLTDFSPNRALHRVCIVKMTVQIENSLNSCSPHLSYMYI